MKAINVLRGFLSESPSAVYPDEVLTHVDEIERELEEEYVALPKDADGKVIHFGDVLDQFGTPMTVSAMSDPDPDQGDCMLELITDGISDGTWVRARKMCHYHAPTVEDVLREFADLVREEQVERAQISDETVAEFAERLQLREVVE